MPAAARALALLTAGAVAAVVLAGCFGQPVARPTRAPATFPHPSYPMVPITDDDVLSYCPTVPAEHFDGLALAVELVYICRADGHRQTDGVYTFGPWESVVQVLNPRTLLRAYSVADAPQETSACTVPPQRTDPLIIWVRGEGDTHAYYAPLDVCGWPQTRAAQDYAQASDGRELIEIDVGSIGDPSSLPYPAEH